MFAFLKNIFKAPKPATTKTIKITWEGPEINKLPDGKFLLVNTGTVYSRRRDALRGYNRWTNGL